MTMMAIITGIATVLGFFVLGIVALLAVIMGVTTAHDFIRARFPRYDLWVYDDVRRWNRRRRKSGFRLRD